MDTDDVSPPDVINTEQIVGHHDVDMRLNSRNIHNITTTVSADVTYVQQEIKTEQDNDTTTDQQQVSRVSF